MGEGRFDMGNLEERIQAYASYAHAECVLSGVDPRPFMPPEASPFEVIGAVVDALDHSMFGVTEARFMEIVVDEGFPEAEAVALWSMRPVLGAKLSEGRIRRVCRRTLRDMRALGLMP